ncbi:hypothetical protein GZH46_01622, partial [Fragariocoptes setiger]
MRASLVTIVHIISASLSTLLLILMIDNSASSTNDTHLGCVNCVEGIKIIEPTDGAIHTFDASNNAHTQHIDNNDHLSLLRVAPEVESNSYLLAHVTPIDGTHYVSDNATNTSHSSSNGSFNNNNNSNSKRVWWSVLMVVTLALINVVVIVGNVLVILAVYASAKLRNVTNLFVVSLAVADLILGVAVLPYSLLFEIMNVWLFGELWCRAWLVVDVWISTASILNLCAISIDRYVAVTRPMRYKALMTNRRARLVIGLVWCVAFLVCLPPLVRQQAFETHLSHVDPSLATTAASSSATLFVANLNIQPKSAQQPTTTTTDIDFVNNYNATTQSPCCDNQQQEENVVVSEPQNDKWACALFEDKVYVIYSSLGSFYIPMLVMLVLYSRIYLVASRTQQALRRGYMTTRSTRRKVRAPSSGSFGYQQTAPLATNNTSHSSCTVSSCGASNHNHKLSNAADECRNPIEVNKSEHLSNSFDVTTDAVESNNNNNNNSSNNGGNHERVTLRIHRGTQGNAHTGAAGTSSILPPATLALMADAPEVRPRNARARFAAAVSRAAASAKRQAAAAAAASVDSSASVSVQMRSNAADKREQESVTKSNSSSTPPGLTPTETAPTTTTITTTALPTTTVPLLVPEVIITEPTANGSTKPEALQMECRPEMQTFPQIVVDSPPQREVEFIEKCSIENASDEKCTSHDAQQQSCAKNAELTINAETKDDSTPAVSVSASIGSLSSHVFASLPGAAQHVRKHSLMLLTSLTARSSATLRRMSMSPPACVPHSTQGDNQHKHFNSSHLDRGDSKRRKQQQQKRRRRRRRQRNRLPREVDEYLRAPLGADETPVELAHVWQNRRTADVVAGFSETSSISSSSSSSTFSNSDDDRDNNNNETSLARDHDDRRDSFPATTMATPLETTPIHDLSSTQRLVAPVNTCATVGRVSNDGRHALPRVVCARDDRTVAPEIKLEPSIDSKQQRATGAVRRARAWASGVRLKSRTNRWHARRLRAETKAAKTVGIIVGCFICCWLPFFTAYPVRALLCEQPDCIPRSLLSIFTWLGYLNSAINPFIYGMFSQEFRHAFKNIICRCRFRDETPVVTLLVDSIIKSIL